MTRVKRAPLAPWGDIMSKLENGLADYSSTTPLFSTAFWVAWITIMYSGDSIVTPAATAYETTAVVFSISTAMLGVALIAAGIFSKRASRVIESKTGMYAMALACAAGTVGVGFEGVLPSALFVACAALTGFATAFIALRGITLYAEVGTKKAAITSCFSLIIGVFMYSFSSMAAAYYGAACVLCIEACLPLLAVFTSFIPLRSEADAIQDDAELRLSPAFWRLVAFIAVIAFSVSSIRGLYPKLMSAEAFSASRFTVALGLLAMAVAIIASVARKPQNYTFGNLFYWLFVASVLLVVPAIATGIDSPIMGVLASIANGLLLLMAWNFLARVSYCSGMSSIRVFGFGFGVAVLGVTVGFIVGDAIAGFDSLASNSILGVAFLIACLLAALVLLRQRDAGSCMMPTHAMLDGLEEDSLESDAPATPAPCEFAENSSHCPVANACPATQSDEFVDENELEPVENAPKRGKFLQKCDAIAEHYGLTARETEVFELLAKHLEAQAIADELFISFNTTRTHIRKIYSKLDVHSRRELTELIDTYELP